MRGIGEDSSPGRSDTLRLGNEGILRPGFVALIGATERVPDLVANVQRGMEPTAIGVHPKNKSVDGLACVPTLSDIPNRPDLAVMAIGARDIEAAFEEALGLGIRSFFVPGLGAEAGKEGAVVAARIARRATESGAAILGHNSFGAAIPDGPSPWLGGISESFRAGSVGIVSQSGSIADAFVALGPRIGFRAVISSGAEMSRDAADWIAELVADPATSAIGLFLETVRRPESFRAALRLAAEAGKPIVCLQVGRSEQAKRAALAHTGAIVGSQRALSAVLSTYGVIEVGDLPEMIELLEIFSKPTRPAGLRIGAITESGGESALLADHANDVGATFPELSESVSRSLATEFPLLPLSNPLDAWALADPNIVYPRTLDLMAASRQFDVLLAQIDLSKYRGRYQQMWCAAIVRTLAQARRDTGIFTAVSTVHQTDPPEELARFAMDHSVCLLRGLQQGVTALAKAARWAPRLEEANAQYEGKFEFEGGLEDFQDGALSEDDSATILEVNGMKFARRERATSPEEAADAAERIGFPVVVKTDGPAHKARDGGVVLGVSDREAAVTAAARIGCPVMVAEQIDPGLEVFCGMVRDDHYGPVFALGLGGANVEKKEPIVTVGPIGRSLARRMVEDASLDRWADPIIQVMLAMDRVTRGSIRVSEIDVNPLICQEQGSPDVSAVDALIVLTTHPYIANE